MKMITLEHADGSISIRGGVGPRFLAKFDGDREAALQYILDNVVPVQNPGVTARIEDVTLPPDRKFREAWRRGAGSIDVDMPSARIIHMNRIRVERDKALMKADNNLRKAEDGNDTDEVRRVRNHRQTLRDIPKTFDLSSAVTADELDALWPSGLSRTQ